MARIQSTTGLETSSVDEREVARLSANAEAWWDPKGPFRPLHKLNAVRLGYIRDQVAAHFGRDPFADRPLARLRLVDVGCGGGLLAEPLARLGATVTGIDAAADNVEAAARHARESDLSIDYRHATAEALAGTGNRFHVVLAMEVVEHVADRDAFLAACCRLLEPGGVIVVSTLNRTVKAFALAIVAAEYVLGWLPRGTHRWEKFVRPAELARGLRRHGVRLANVTGLAYSPLLDRWRLVPDAAVNYLATGVEA
ncbi:MAG: bifunctional 2-polyprenyl-6-hydroxyphenol methylase/3-demethylubiquinol 3-O-methyltransferase UbiG [Alphaproteobacteria bacterium]